MNEITNKKNNKKDLEQLNALVDGELNEQQREVLLDRLDGEPELRDELCDIRQTKELLQFAYPLSSKNHRASSTNKQHFVGMAASLLFVLSLGFLGGYISFSSESYLDNQLALDKSDIMKIDETAMTLPGVNEEQQKIIIYLGSSNKKKFDETLNKAELLLQKYKKDEAKVYVVTSAGGIDLLRTGNTGTQQRIKAMSGLYKGLHFVACNNQIYHLHKKGEAVNLVDEVEVAPSAVQFVVDHLEKGWKYIAI